MRAKQIYESIGDIFKPKDKEKIKFSINIFKEFLDAISHFDKGKIQNLLSIGIDINYQNEYGETALMYAVMLNNIIMVRFLLECGADVNIKDDEGNDAFHYIFESQHQNKPFVQEKLKEILLKAKKEQDEIKESVGGAGYAVYGGGSSGGFGNPSMQRGGMFFGRGSGFGGSSNLSGGPNLMYTYSVKPLNQTLQPLSTSQDQETYIHVGSRIKGNILNNKKPIEGQILVIQKDEDNNILYYLVLDKNGIKQQVDPTSVYLIEPDEFEDPIMKDVVANESFYPLINESLDRDSYKNVKEKIENSRKLSKELKDKIIPLIIDDQLQWETD